MHRAPGHPCALPRRLSSCGGWSREGGSLGEEPREHCTSKSHLRPLAPGSFTAGALPALQLSCLLGGPGVTIFGSEQRLCQTSFERVTCAGRGLSLRPVSLCEVGQKCVYRGVCCHACLPPAGCACWHLRGLARARGFYSCEMSPTVKAVTSSKWSQASSCHLSGERKREFSVSGKAALTSGGRAQGRCSGRFERRTGPRRCAFPGRAW